MHAAECRSCFRTDERISPFRRRGHAGLGHSVIFQMGNLVQTHFAISLSVFPLVALLVGRASTATSAESCSKITIVVEPPLPLALRLAAAVFVFTWVGPACSGYCTG